MFFALVVLELLELRKVVTLSNFAIVGLSEKQKVAELSLLCSIVEQHKTGFKLVVTLQSGCVNEILTLCRIHKIFFEKYHEKAFIQSFPTMYNTI